MEYDVFISHASEDKNDFVRELAHRLEENQVTVWYDEFTLIPGSGLRRSIDKGLANSRFGIIVLSESFFKKEWANWELDGLVARQNTSENDLILPIWLNVSRADILSYSPPLADKVAIQANIGIDHIIERLLKVIKPEGSTLVVARDLLFKEGISAPLVTDDWWLDIVEYCGKEYLYHEYLSFLIPWKSWDAKDRGEYIAKHAMQKLWQEEGEEILISQLSHPNVVLEFIETNPGLKTAAKDNPSKIAFYFPQLTIRGFGGFLEASFDVLLSKPYSLSNRNLCREEIALRHPTLGNYNLAELADFYFTGAGGGIGPSTSQHDYIDFVFWLLSKQSQWLPKNIHQALMQGLKEWAVWPWGKNSNIYNATINTGSFRNILLDAKKSGVIEMTEKATLDIKERGNFSIDRLDLPESVEELFNAFLKEQMIESWLAQETGNRFYDEI